MDKLRADRPAFLYRFCTNEVQQGLNLLAYQLSSGEYDTPKVGGTRPRESVTTKSEPLQPTLMLRTLQRLTISPKIFWDPVTHSRYDFECNLSWRS